MTLLMLLVLIDVHVACVHACLCLAYLSWFPQILESPIFFSIFQVLEKKTRHLNHFPKVFKILNVSFIN